MSIPQTHTFEDEFPLIRSCPTLNEIRLAGEIKDLTIEVKNGEVLHAHRIILAARIPSLRATLTGPLGEANSVLRLRTVPLSLATALISYVYTGKMEMTPANMMGMVAFAKMLKISAVENWGANLLAGSVTLENLATTWDFAKSLNIGLLMEACITLMETQFIRFVSCDLFVRLPGDTVLSLVRSEDLSVDSE
nr:unnamed protein product [Spirometra erinaceieuropaei]